MDATRRICLSWLLLLAVSGCAVRTSLPGRAERKSSVIQSSGSRSKGSAGQRAARTQRRDGKGEPERNGLPDALSPLPTLSVRHFAFANDGAQRSSADAHAAGAVEDDGGVTVCLLWGALSVPDGSMIMHPAPFAASAEARCFREDGARLARAARAQVGRVGDDVSFVVALERDGSTVRRAYAFSDDGKVREAAAHTKHARARPSVGKPPPWPRTFEEELKRAGSKARGVPRVALPDATLVRKTVRMDAPSWVSLLRRDSEIETRTLVDHENVVLAVTLSRASAADSEPARELVVAREKERWVASPTLPEVIVQAAPAASLGAGAMLVLTREQNLGNNGSRRMLYADKAHLRVFVAAQGELSERSKLALGEIGYTRLVGKNRVWRVFYQARVTTPGCLLVRRDHAFTAYLDTRTAKVSERSRLRLGLEGLPSEAVLKYMKTEGKYGFDGSGLVRGACQEPAPTSP